MMASSHIIVGAATWTWLSARFGLPALDPLALGMAVLGSLAPDIDHPKSALGSRLKPISIPISVVFGHRGITHSLLAVGACTWLFLESGAYARFTAPFLVGYMMHLAGDLLSPAGLPLLYPLKRRRTFALPIIKTGGFSEQIVVVLLCGWLISGLFGCDWRGILDTGPWRSVVAVLDETERALSRLRPVVETHIPPQARPVPAAPKPVPKPLPKPPQRVAAVACGGCG
ncbi:inner membrane protein [Azospirillum agricola]|uniref:metal-dependent hydrolase n=1 Tax=Azospirillum agricola TaxID=1720247 RepID=UPI001AE6D300|nr:metal-dependent hydrolase [Azospirillum agricola]MBP2231335.1 inner membrane protein [Azospirillum agricola]